MTIQQAIARVDELKPNTYSHDMKIGWLSSLDEAAWEFESNYHRECGERSEYHGYDEGTDLDTVLLIPSPYDEIYIYYLFSKIDFFNEEYDKFNNSNAMYDSVWSEFVRWYNATHQHKSVQNRYW